MKNIFGYLLIMYNDSLLTSKKQCKINQINRCFRELSVGRAFAHEIGSLCFFFLQFSRICHVNVFLIVYVYPLFMHAIALLFDNNIVDNIMQFLLEYYILSSGIYRPQDNLQLLAEYGVEYIQRKIFTAHTLKKIEEKSKRVSSWAYTK